MRSNAVGVSLPDPKLVAMQKAPVLAGASALLKANYGSDYLVGSASTGHGVVDEQCHNRA